MLANPQPDQFTKISNELMEHLPLYKFNGTQLRIIIVVLRYTYGFLRKECSLSLSFLSKSICVHKEQIKRELNSLINEKVINVVKGADFNSTRVLAFNKNYDEWLTEKSELKSTQEAKKFTGSEKVDLQEADSFTPTGSELDPQERKYKENIKESKPRKENPNTNLIKYFCSEYLKKFEITYMPNWARDGTIIKSFLDNGYTEEFIENYIVWFLNCNDEFLNKAGYSIPLLKSRVEKYHMVLNKPKQQSKYVDGTNYKPGE